jgi:hypothetical protein
MRAVVDVNGDGLVDMLAREVEGTTDGGSCSSCDTSVHFHVNTGTRWVRQSQFPAPPTFPIKNPDYVAQTPDLDGDGIPDMIESGAPGTPSAACHHWIPGRTGSKNTGELCGDHHRGGAVVTYV